MVGSEEYEPPLGLALAVEDELRARGARVIGSEMRFRCPAHDDRNASADYNPRKHVWICRSCDGGGGIEDLASYLGIQPADYSAIADPAPSQDQGGWGESVDPPGPLYHPANGKPIASFELRDVACRLFAVHARFEGGPNGKKKFAWWRNNAWKLGGVTPAEAPLYGSELLSVRQSDLAIVCEGEKAADALRKLGVLALGTVTGARGTPGRRALAVLAGRSVVLWPDNDQVGRDHMHRIASNLPGIALSVKVFAPAGLPVGADAVEYLADRGEIDREGLLAVLLAQAHESVPGDAANKEGPSSLPPTSARCLADVPVKPVSFLWRPRLPLGKITLLDGDPGQGKSFIAAALAAALSIGKGLPEADEFEPVSSLLFTAEDGVEDTLRPRIEAMGADLSRIFAYEHSIDLGRPEGLMTVRREIERHRPALVVVDPIVAYLGTRTDMHRANEVRAILGPLADMAASFGCAMLVVRHLSKARSGRALHAGMGSVDFSAAARSVLLAGSCAADPQAHALVHLKCNVATQAPALGYRLSEKGGFEWTGTSSLTAADLLEPEIGSAQRTAQQEAVDWLHEVLRAGPVPASEVRREAEEAGQAWRTVERAARQVGIRKRRLGFGPGSGWEWSLQAEAA